MGSADVAPEISSARNRIAAYLHADPARKSRERDGKLEFRCPVHDDSTPSAYLGDYGWACQGCGVRGTLKELSDALGLPWESVGSRGYTLEDYAVEKGFDLATLRRWGLETVESNGSGVVAIPYRSADGSVLRRQIRGPAGKKWWEGKGGGVYLYGMDILARADADPRSGGVKRPVLVVEGASDCHALWSVGVLAVGVPGASSWKSEWAALLAGREVYVWEEPDQGGAALLRALAADFPQALVVRVEGVKDPCALRQKNPADFREAVRRAMREAYRIGTPKPPVAFDMLIGSTLDRLGEERTASLDIVPTHLDAWNRACGEEGGREGLAHGWTVALGGKPGSRKSLFAGNMIHSAIENGERVGLVSLEMTQSGNTGRLLSIVSGEPAHTLGYGRDFDPVAWGRASRAMAGVFERTGGGIYTNRGTVSTKDEVVSSILYYWEYHGCRTFVIDYMQLAWVQGADRVDAQIMEVSHDIRRVSKDNKLLSICLSQLTREASKAPSTPIAQNLLGGFAIDADAFQVGILDHSREEKLKMRLETHRGVSEVDTGIVESVFVLDKNRVGPSKLDIPYSYDSATHRISQREVSESRGW